MNTNELKKLGVEIGVETKKGFELIQAAYLIDELKSQNQLISIEKTVLEIDETVLATRETVALFYVD